MSKDDWRITLALLGGTLGAAGWIVGAALSLMNAPAQPPGINVDLAVVMLCAASVLLVGFVIWLLYLAGRRLSALFISEALLGASLLFGTAAIIWMHARGVLAHAVGGHAGRGQPGNELWESLGRHVPPELAYAVPLLVLGMMGVVCWPPMRRRLFGVRTHIQRGTFDRERR